MKLAGTGVMRGFAEHLGFSYAGYRGIGVLEVAGAVGLVLGRFEQGSWVGAAAATGLFLLMVGAVICHLRIGDGPGRWGPAGALGVLCLIAAGGQFAMWLS